MIADYYTLYHVAAGLQRRLRGLQLLEAFTQERHEAVFHFGTQGTGDTRPNGQFWLVVSCEPSRNYLLLRSSFARAKRNTLDLFPSVTGDRIDSSSISEADREVTLAFRSGRQIVIRLFRSTANILLLESDGTPLDAFLKSRAQRAGALPRAKARTVSDPVSASDFANKFRTAAAKEAKGVLKALYPRLSSPLLDEAFARAELTPSSLPQALADTDLTRLFRAVSQVIRDLLEHPSPRVYRSDDGTVLFSLIPLKRLGSAAWESFDSLDQAIRARLAASAKAQGVSGLRSRLIHHLESESTRLQRALGKVDHDLPGPDEAERDELFGRLLMAHLAEIRKRTLEVVLPNDFSSSQEPVSIPLVPTLSPAKNAESYFSRAKKARKVRGELLRRIEQLDQMRALVQSDLGQAEGTDDEQQLEEIARRYPLFSSRIGKRDARASSQERHPFRVFHVSGGFEVWAGKNSANNDLLTMKHARPNDLWFHARGSSGSHVILRAGTGKGEPSKQAIEQAAAIAAFYSGMKGARTVPVAMTLRKYVRKPKGSSPGTVTLEREKLVFVEPALPPSSA